VKQRRSNHAPFRFQKKSGVHSSTGDAHLLVADQLVHGSQNQRSPNGAATTAPKQKTIQVRITGMTCAACARGLEASFRKMVGVEKAAVDYKAGQAEITFDPGKQTAESLSKFVTNCGYQVKETKVI
jgi:copper chaperone CopZ